MTLPAPLTGTARPGPKERNLVVLPDLVAEGPVLPPPPGWEEVRLQGLTMGTSWSLIAFAPPGHAARLRAIVESVCARIIALFSPWIPESEVSALHRNPSPEVTLSPDFGALLAPLLEIAAEAGGASDPALGALSDLWGFGPPGPRSPAAPLPTEAGIAQARQISGSHRLRLNGARLSRPPGLRFDFSGSAKGHAVDQLSAALSAAGFGFHLIGIGGEYYGRGLRPGMQPWWVEIEAPQGLARMLVALNGQALASSGDWRRFFEHEGQIYAHTIDPESGWPVRNSLASVSVIAASAMRADALATALLVMGEARGMEFARSKGIAAVMIRREGQGHSACFTPAMQRMMEDAA